MITLVSNVRQLATTVLSQQICFETEKRLATFEICLDDIVKIIRSLNPNKAHGHDEISIRIYPYGKPLAILFRNCFESECFPKEWKKANINNRSEIIGQYYYCQFAQKCLKK